MNGMVPGGVQDTGAAQREGIQEPDLAKEKRKAHPIKEKQALPKGAVENEKEKKSLTGTTKKGEARQSKNGP